MPLYLTGGGEQEDFAALDRHFIDNLPHDATIGVIPQALDAKDYSDSLERIASCFDLRKVSRLELIRDLKGLSSSDYLAFDALMIEGGNTFQLIQALRTGGCAKHLKTFLDAHRYIYADSAGAIVLGADIRTAFLGEEADEDFAKIQNYRGLEVLESVSVHCHYLLEDAEQLGDLVYTLGHPILALSESTGIFVHHGKDEIMVFGREPLEAFAFMGHKLYYQGHAFKYSQVLNLE